MYTYRILAMVISATLMLTVAATGQTTGVITGTITDNSGAVVPGARVAVRNMGTGEERVTETNESGVYVAYALPVGRYEVDASAKGFKKTTQGNIELNVADRLAINLVLQVGEVTETVSVSTEAPVVETEKGDIGYTVNTRQMTDLAVNGRTFAQLIQLLPGASRTMGDEGGVSFFSGRGFAINGQRDKYAGVTLDGVENTDMGNQSGMFTSPGLETISEFKVQTSNYSAEYGTGGGANILVVTRSGTKEFHGAAYNYLRNDVMDARNFFAQSKPTLRYNNFGYRIGGPVYIPGVYNKNKDKTFFFWAQEWRRRRTQTIMRAATPTEAMRTGDFAAEAARIGRPVLDPNSGQPFPNNLIPASRISNNAKLLHQSVFPAPNTPGFLNFQQNGGIQENWRQETINVTHQVSASTQAMVRYIQDTWVQSMPNVLWGGQAFPTIG